MFERTVRRVVETGKAHKWLRPLGALTLLALFGGAALLGEAVKLAARARETGGRVTAALRELRQDYTEQRERRKERADAAKPVYAPRRPARRVLAGTLAACLLVTLLPVSALAAESHSVSYTLTGLEAFGGDKTSAAPVTAAGELMITIFPEDGYKLPEDSGLTVSMGNAELIQGSGYILNPVKKNGRDSPSGWAIGIMSVTGDVVISAEGVALSRDATLKSISYSYSNGADETLNYLSNEYRIDTQDGVYSYDVDLPNSINNPFVYVFESEDKNDAAQIFDSDWWRTDGGITLDGDGEGTASLTVKAESGATQEYTVRFTTAAPPVTSYDVWVGGTRITSANASDVLNDGEVSYDAATKTLTLNGASITGTYKEAGIFAENAALAAIALTGENVIGDAGDTALNCGIMNYNNPASTAINSELTIKGGGTLTVYLKRANGLGVSGVAADDGLTLDGVSLEVINKDGKEAIAVQPRTYNGLGADKGLTVKNGAKVTLANLWEGIIAASGTVAISEDSTVSITTAGPAINGGTVSIGSARVNVESSEQNENAIVADRIAISSDAHVTAKSIYPALYAISGINITGGTVEAASANDAGIYTPGYIAISGNGTQVTANGRYAGLQGDSGITIIGGTVNAASTANCGIFTPANLAISGEHTQVTANGYYPALRGNNGITITGGTIDAVSTNDIGIFGMNTIEITGGSVHAKGGTGWAAIAARTEKSGEAQPPLTIALTNMAEENGCIPKASGWFDVSLDGGTETRSWSSFVPADADALIVTNGAMTNAVNEVRLAPPTVTTVHVTPETAAVQKGTTRQFHAEVIGTYLPTRNVTWSIEGDHVSGTSISSTGLLTVASDETAATLTVKAVSTVDAARSGTATVTVTDTPVTAYTLTVSGGSGSGEYAAGAQITVTADTPAQGKRFKAWTATGMTLADAAQSSVTITMPANAVTLTATYEDDTPTTYTVTFDAQGGSVSPGTAETNGEGKLTSLPTPTRSNHRFDGWFTAANGGTEVTLATVFSANATIYARWTSTGSGGGGGGSSNSTTHTTKNPDGSTTTTVTKPNGTKTETTKAPDGTKTVVETQKDGTRTETVQAPDGTRAETVTTAQGDRTYTEQRADGTKITAAAPKSGQATAKVTLPERVGETVVSFPVTDGTVVLRVLPNGAEEPVPFSLVEGGRVYVRLAGDAELKVETRAGLFDDMGGHWAEESADFTGARELFEGTAPRNFAPEQTMTRAMLAMVLYRMDGRPQVGQAGFDGVDAAAWYAPGAAWASEHGIAAGDGGAFDGGRAVTRQELAVMLWNYAKYDGLDVSADGDGPSCSDMDKAAEWAVPALEWASGTGILQGDKDGALDPTGTATRAEAAAMLERFVIAVVQ